MSSSSGSPATTARSRRRPSISPTATICRWSPPTRRSSSTREDYEAHDALIAIAEGSVIADDNRRRLTPDNFLKSQAEMAALFADLPEAIDSTVEIARRCSFFPKNRQPILPRFAARDVADADAANKAEAEELARQAREGLGRAAAHARPDARLHRGGIRQAARITSSRSSRG